MPTVAVAHYPEGAGHATRMVAIARALEAGGASVVLAGGGPGERFAALNGYDEYEPTPVDYIGDYQDGGSLWRVVTGSVPASGRRVVEYVRWLRRVDPDALVTDDMFAAMAAPLARVPLFVCTHNAPGLYDDGLTRLATRGLTALQVAAARDFYFPTVWPPSSVEPRGVTRVPPIALDAEESESSREDLGPEVDESADSTVDVLLVPSHYSRDLDALVEALAADGRDVTLVGGDDWQPVASLLPHVRAASVVVCSGYSTIMEAAVAGTPCVVLPFTDEQRGVGRVIEDGAVPGITVVSSVDEVRRAVADPPAGAAGMANGADVVAARVLEAL